MSNLTTSRVLACAFTLSIQTTILAQGPLTPPGPPGPTFKTLQQVEPRTPISALPFVINQPGSYYVTTNLTGGAGQHGITISAEDVSLDLGGWELRGVGGSLSGILMNPASKPHVRNGSILGWGQDGINGTNGGGGMIEDIRSFNNARHGITFNSGSHVRRCIAGGNGGVGILTSNGVEVDDCVAGGNGQHGIQVGTSSNVRRCLATGNGTAGGGSGITGSGLDGLNIIECNADNNRGSGIATIGRTMVLNCVARNNTNSGVAVGPASSVTGCNVNDNGEHGIVTGFGSTISGCAASSNRLDGIQTGYGSSILGNACRNNLGDGIEFAGDCSVVNNTCDGNGIDIATFGANIHARTDPSGPGDNRIENNNATDGDVGLLIESANNIIFNNTVRANATNYSIVAGNQLNILLCQIPQHVPWPATIKLAGSLTGFRNTNGITIASDDVTIDLNDHALIGVAQSLDGINVLGSRTNITIRNGTLRGWGGDGVDAGSAVNAQLRNLGASRNNGRGLVLGEGGVMTACNARTNTSDGIVVSSGCRVVDCSTSRNGSEGILAGSGCTLEGCTAFDNAANGIYGGPGTRISGCTAYSNGTNGIALLNVTIIVTTPNGGQVQNCVSRANAGNGIQVGSRVQVLNNNCADNTFAGFSVLGSACRVDSNHATGGQRSFHVTGTDNLIIRNSAQGASVSAYDTAAGNHQAALIVSPGLNFASSSPWANFSF